MKKYFEILLLAAVILNFTGCGSSKTENYEADAKNIQSETTEAVKTSSVEETDKEFWEVGRFEGVVSDYDIDYYLNEYSFGIDCSIDENTALEIGNAVIKSVIGEEEFEKTHFAVREIKDRDIFVFSRYKADTEVLSGDICAAIGKDGSVLKVWATD
ncbi:MAG: hypothetical protein LUG66_09890 [Clostridiales bacterium]|nr:hypothetical protein [Clostridiales bacterium]